MGVGYASADVSAIREDLADNFDCESVDEAVDFWGYNIYSWCGDSTYQESGYKARTEEFRNNTVPAFFDEYGCNNGVTPRQFTEVKALYGDTMAELWSGGIVYMYFQEANGYGLVSVADSTSVSKLADFTSYSNEIASATPIGTNKASYTPTDTALQSCPTVGSGWKAMAFPLPPTPDRELCECVYDAAGCVASSSLSTKKMGSLLGTVCGMTDCSGFLDIRSSGAFVSHSYLRSS